jgi:hypothetical protein
LQDKQGVSLTSQTVCSRSAFGAAKHIHEFRNFLALIGFVAGGYGVLDTMADMVAKDFLLNAPERCAHGVDLRDDVDTVTVFIDHSRQPSYLSFDPAEAFAATDLDVVSHAAYIPP